MSGRPLRFCMVSTFYPPYNFGGDGITVRRLAGLLAERGHQVEVVHCIDSYRLTRTADSPVPGPYDDHPGVVHHGLRSRAGFLSPLVTHQTTSPGLKRGRLRSILGSGRFDVIHFHNISLIGPTALGYGKATTLLTMHDHWLVCPMHVLWRFNREVCPARRCVRCTLHAGRPPQLWRYTGALRRSLRHVDAFIAPSRFTRDQHFARGLPAASRVVQLQNFTPRPAPASADEARPHARPYFLFAGRLERVKGAHVLVRAFTRYHEADLLVAGTGGDAEWLKTMAEGRTHIHFLGRVPFERLEVLMRHAIALVVPSVGYEVLPTAILEAHALGTPVIGHDLGPIPEMLESGSGLTYRDEAELIAALETLRGDSGRRRAMGARAREVYLAEWTPERHLARYLELIHELQAERGVA